MFSISFSFPVGQPWVDWLKSSTQALVGWPKGYSPPPVASPKGFNTPLLVSWLYCVLCEKIIGRFSICIISLITTFVVDFNTNCSTPNNSTRTFRFKSQGTPCCFKRVHSITKFQNCPLWGIVYEWPSLLYQVQLRSVSPYTVWFHSWIWKWKFWITCCCNNVLQMLYEFFPLAILFFFLGQ